VIRNFDDEEKGELHGSAGNEMMQTNAEQPYDAKQANDTASQFLMKGTRM
jgi:hypothetical protein